MADTKISALTELTVPPDPTDELVVVDKSDTTMAASGTDKRLQFSNLFDWAESGDLSTIEPDDAATAGTSVEHARADHRHGIVASAASTLTGTNAEGTSTSFARADHNHAFPVWGGVPGFTPLAAPAAAATGSTNNYYALLYVVLSATTITGIEVKNGATLNGSLRPYLCNALTGAINSGSIASATTQTGATVRQRVPFDTPYAAAPGLYYAVMHYSSATATAFMATVLGTVGQAGNTATPNSLTVTAADLTATSVAIVKPY